MAKLTERFPATVTANADDEQRGRIRVACAGLMGDEESELPMWVEPILDWGWFYVPDVGEIVEVEVVAGTELDEHYGQASIDNLDIRWRGKRFYTDAEGTVGEQDQDPEVDARQVHAEFLTNYGKRRGFATPWGHIIVFDDTEGDHRIVITHSAEQLKHGEPFEDETKYTRIEIEPDGSIRAEIVGRHLLHFQNDPNGDGIFELNMAYDSPGGTPAHAVKIDTNTPEVKVSLASEEHIMHLDGSVPKMEVSLASGDHVATLDGSVPSFNVGLGGGAGALIDQSDANTITTLGDGAVSAVIAENLQTWLDSVYTPAIADMHDNHVHPLNQYVTPLIPSGTAPCLPGGPPSPDTPVVPAVLQSYDTGITSTHLLFPDA